MPAPTFAKKLIEVALPLDAINKESAREKSIRHGHPSTLHLWWARRPLATARAVIFASLVDDPSAHPEQFPDEASENAERQRLFRIIEDLVKWENVGNEEVLEAARSEIRKSVGNEPLTLLDPFAGGGAIPLEAQRLGLTAIASDLNPVAVLINKAMIEIPPKFAGQPPVHPDAPKKITGKAGWKGASGLAEDVRLYGEWMKEEAFRRIGHLYPKVKIPGEGEATVIAWIWARTVKCPNPACGCEMPLVHAFELSKKKGKEAFVRPDVRDGQVVFTVQNGKGAPEGTVSRTGAKCVCCDTPVGFPYIREEGRAGRMGAHLMAIVAEGKHGRLYLSPTPEQIAVADCPEPPDCPESQMPEYALGFRVQLYGMDMHKKLFTNRQLTALTTFSDLVREAQKRAEADAKAAGLPDDGKGLDKGGTGATAYGEAVGVYLAFIVDKLVDYHSSLCSWHNSGEKIRNTFGRQAIPMVWDFAEANPFCESSGSVTNMLGWIVKCETLLPVDGEGRALQYDVQSDNGLRDIMISTDPPYYDNIGYADLSDYFYVWLRKTLKFTFPKLCQTLLVPKKEELVATPYRFWGSKEKAQAFFEAGMLQACQNINLYTRPDIPVTIYYAYKQSDAEAGDAGEMQSASTGWETMLSAIVQAGFALTGTWPMRTELANRAVARDTNALASSIVLVCRKRPADAPSCSRREFLISLKRELPEALHDLIAANIAPVDLAQAAIGPGMGVFSKYAQVLEANGQPMSVRAALQLINQEVDSYVGVDEVDAETRFCLALYRQAGFDELPFGEADQLARAKNTSVERLAQRGVVVAAKGRAHLVEREHLPKSCDGKLLWHLTQRLAHEMATGGREACARLLSQLPAGDSAPSRARDLAYHLFTLADQKGWTQEALVYNALINEWTDIQDTLAELRRQKPQQGGLF